MDKSEGKDWFARTLNNFTEETAKVYKISRLKLEIGTANKSRNEKLSLISRRLVELIKEGKIDPAPFEPEYSAILSLEAKTAALEQEIYELKSTLKIGLGRRMDSNPPENLPAERPEDTADKTENAQK